MLSVHFLEDLEASYLEHLTPRLDGRVSLTHGERLPDNPDYDILIAGRFREEHLTASPNLRSVIIPWAGLPVSARELLLHYPQITVHNMHYNAVMVAETAAALMLAAARRTVPVDQALRRGDWTVRYARHKSIRLCGKTALILGYGAIGRRIAGICEGLGMRVRATRRTPKEERDGAVEIYFTTWLHRLLPEADVLLIATPLTPETKNMIGAYELSLLPDRATVVNIARGHIIEERALWEELRSERIQAGLDVWYNYPRTPEARPYTLPSNFPMHTLDNVVMSPHMAEHSVDTEIRHAEELANMLNAAASGNPLSNSVDPVRGY